MHFWPNKSINKTLPAFSKTHLAALPKGTSVEDAKKLVEETRYNKLLFINQLPKISKASKSTRNND